MSLRLKHLRIFVRMPLHWTSYILFVVFMLPGVKVTQSLAYFSSGDPFYFLGPDKVSNPEVAEFVKNAQPIVTNQSQ